MRARSVSLPVRNVRAHSRVIALTGAFFVASAESCAYDACTRAVTASITGGRSICAGIVAKVTSTGDELNGANGNDVIVGARRADQTHSR